MAGSLNKVQLIGHLGQDPVFKDHGSFVSCQLSIATTETWKDKGGERRERTEWTRCEATGRLAEVCRDILAKGHLVYVEGSLSTDRVQRKDGDGFDYYTRVKLVEMQKLSKRDDSRAGNDEQQGGQSDYDDSQAGSGDESAGDSGEGAPAGAAPAASAAPAAAAPAKSASKPAAGDNKPWARGRR